MAKRPIITAEEVRRLVSYDEVTGLFTWLRRPVRLGHEKADNVFNSKFAGKLAGSIDPSHGYIKVNIYGRRYYAHRLAWAYVNGHWPDGIIDHINLDVADNRIDNLRIVDPAQSSMNTPMRRTNKLGVKGVILTPWGYHPQLQVRKKTIYLGYYKTLDEAKSAYDAASKKHHGEFGRSH
jgi:hypothetical protein